MPVSSEEKQWLQDLVATRGWKVAMQQVLWPLLYRASSQLDTCEASKAPRFQGAKAALREFAATVYELSGTKSPFDEHAEALLGRFLVERQEVETEETTSGRSEIADLLARHGSGAGPLV